MEGALGLGWGDDGGQRYRAGQRRIACQRAGEVKRLTEGTGLGVGIGVRMNTEKARRSRNKKERDGERHDAPGSHEHDQTLSPRIHFQSLD